MPQNSNKTRLPKPKGEISRRELLQLLSPLGKLTLDSSRCTGCGLCALECPTGALALSQGDNDTFLLVFKHGACFACGRCTEVCPEKCLQLERVIELDKLDSQTVLFEDVMVRCSGCGAPVGPRTMINKLQARMVAKGQHSGRFDLCPECKSKSQFSQLRI